MSEMETAGLSDAVAAVDAAWSADEGSAPEASAVAPVAPSPVAPSEPAVAGPAVQGEGATEMDSFTSLDPNTLPPEVRPFYQSLQADYTRKMQEAAPYRKLGLPAEELSVAAEFYARAQDPNNWGTLYEQLGEAMSAYGYEFETEGGFEPQPFVGGAPQTGADLSAYENDPEFAPLVQHIRQLEEQLGGLGTIEQRLAQMEAQQMYAQEEAYQAAMIGEVQRQEAAIRTANPHYQEADIDAVYELSSFYNGDLVQAQQAYERIVNNRLARFLQQKQGGAANVGIQPLPGGNVQTISPAANDDDIPWTERAKRALQLRGVTDEEIMSPS